jgi:murein DD-endopeptidase MepM/ murein hydrolase activator NlpD
MKVFLAACLLFAACAEPHTPQRRSRIRVFSVRADGGIMAEYDRGPMRPGRGPCGELDWPVDAPISSPFGPRDGRAHDGIDLAVPEGTPVRAACDGRVAYAGSKLRGYGNLVLLDHGAGLTTIYAHNSLLLVQEGQELARGSVIARSGNTGHSTAPHLHFEVRADGRPRDPLLFLPDGQSNRIAAENDPRRSGLSKARYPVQGRDAAHRSRPVLPPLH